MKKSESRLEPVSNDRRRVGEGNEGEAHLPDTDELSKLLSVLRTNDVTTFEFEQGDLKLFLRRQAAPRLAGKGAALAVGAEPVGHPEPPRQEREVVREVVAAPVRNPEYHEVRSQMVGTFYRRPSPEAQPFVDVGSVVKKGDVLCIIEAMKLMNEINSDASGKVVEICIEDGRMVEFGEVLFRIDRG